MSRKRLGRLQRVATIIPLALLSAAWTVSVAGIGSVAAPSAAQEGPGRVTDGTSVPEESIEDPASISEPSQIEGLNGGNEAGIVSASSTNAIPAAALAAYQRAETVINSADESCNLTWQLIAALGRVESNHGRFGGNVLNNDGVATPGIYGIPLNGQNKTKAIPDTDAGVYDKDTEWDRAVGPMQFIPSTWQVVGVDADDDAARNPQDIDDASLAAAVYLCSGDGDLSTVAGQRAAVYRYNHSQAYVDLVLKIMDAYLEGDFTSVPNNSTAAGYVVPEPPKFNTGAKTNKNNIAGPRTNKGNTIPGSTGGGSGTGTGTPGTAPGTGGGSGGGDKGSAGDDKPGVPGIPKDNPISKGVEKGAEAVEEVVKGVDEGVGGVTSNLISGVLGLLGKQEARTACQAAYPKLSQSLQLLNCLVSYGLQKK
ncbi:lytic transglycosylase domain-containing protein [Nocardioides sp. zg-536]|uniref:Lytic transglycosylase domain-containing protein n=1 Tax=Nocardioides faecalis TaxID=2803858 RepID=A0A938YBT0_9ACTN|nr:lytic transglycosylase domain-containing protein [Nocardioides faecalis]MBM9461091.1 lytic transglycosylase domain-containing protein [Nocardioides faecalis]QVI59171.1 lytic transglycosylase domain-containing protein [Nocardioides faecalis]